MRLHLITIGKPKLAYAQLGWNEYIKRLGRYHSVRITHLPDKFADDASKILQTAEGTYSIGLVIEGTQLSSPQLAAFLERLAFEAREVSLIIGGPEGLPQAVIDAVDYQLSLSKLTMPHDLAMVALSEALYRASTITAGAPYHK